MTRPAKPRKPRRIVVWAVVPLTLVECAGNRPPKKNAMLHAGKWHRIVEAGGRLR